MTIHDDYAGFIPARYPYTYAYDLLRCKRPVEGDNSRSDQAQYVGEFCRERNLDKHEFCSKIADIYIRREVAIRNAEDSAKLELQSLMPLPKPPVEV